MRNWCLKFFSVMEEAYAFSSNNQASFVKIFNHISNDIKNLPLTTFKRKLRPYLIEKCFYNLLIL